MATFVPYLIALYCLSLVHAQSQMFIDRHQRTTFNCPEILLNALLTEIIIYLLHAVNTTLSLLEVVGVNVADPQGKGTLSLNQPILA